MGLDRDYLLVSLVVELLIKQTVMLLDWLNLQTELIKSSQMPFGNRTRQEFAASLKNAGYQQSLFGWRCETGSLKSWSCLLYWGWISLTGRGEREKVCVCLWDKTPEPWWVVNHCQRTSWERKGMIWAQIALSRFTISACKRTHTYIRSIRRENSDSDKPVQLHWALNSQAHKWLQLRLYSWQWCLSNKRYTRQREWQIIMKWRQFSTAVMEDVG